MTNQQGILPVLVSIKPDEHPPPAFQSDNNDNDRCLGVGKGGPAIELVKIAILNYSAMQ